MSEYVNTVDSRGDAAICLAILNKTLDQITDTHCVTVGGYAFYKFSALHTAIFANAKNIEQYAFAYCSALTTVKIPLSESVGYFSFYKCTGLTIADFPRATSVSRSAFNECTALKALVLRRETLVTLSDINALEDTPIESGTGYIYVPGALVDSYKADSKWSTYANQFRKLEDYTVDGTTTGEVDTTRCRVRFFNEDGTLLGYVMVPTGGNAVYPGDEPVKEGDWAFTGWSPDPVNVTADMDCYAQFRNTALYSHKLLERTLVSYDTDNITKIRTHAFNTCANLNVLVLRGSSVCTIEDYTAFNSSGISKGTGYVYVPAAMLDRYKGDSTWTRYATQLRAIEDYPDICGGGE